MSQLHPVFTRRPSHFVLAGLLLCGAVGAAGCSSGVTATAPTTTTTNPGCAAVAQANVAYDKAIEQPTATAASLSQATAEMRSSIQRATSSLPRHAAKQATYAIEELTTIEQHLQNATSTSFATDLLAFHTTLKNVRILCSMQG